MWDTPFGLLQLVLAFLAGWTIASLLFFGYVVDRVRRLERML